MFGYIRPFKPQMRICEFDIYQAVYCGLCKQLGHSYGIAARFTLSYDFAFLSILSMALEDAPPQFCKERCFVNPLKKKGCCQLNEASLFSACAAMIMLYYKVEDNRRDSGFWGKLLMSAAFPFASSARKKAKLQYPLLDKVVSNMMNRQFALEASGCSCIDEAAEPSAKSLGEIFAMLAKEQPQQRILERMGYLLGRWVYLMDALDDLEEDLRSGNYNVFIMAHQLTIASDLSTIHDEIAALLNHTVAEIASTYELLELKRYKPILDNVIYLGLKNSLSLLREKRSNLHDRSL